VAGAYQPERDHADSRGARSILRSVVRLLRAAVRDRSPVRVARRVALQRAVLPVLLQSTGARHQLSRRRVGVVRHSRRHRAHREAQAGPRCRVVRGRGNGFGGADHAQIGFCRPDAAASTGPRNVGPGRTSCRVRGACLLHRVRDCDRRWSVDSIGRGERCVCRSAGDVLTTGGECHVRVRGRTPGTAVPDYDDRTERVRLDLHRCRAGAGAIVGVQALPSFARRPCSLRDGASGAIGTRLPQQLPVLLRALDPSGTRVMCASVRRHNATRCGWRCT
jgi:hypothetical protein